LVFEDIRCVADQPDDLVQAGPVEVDPCHDSIVSKNDVVAGAAVDVIISRSAESDQFIPPKMLSLP
jgi:hypothetical protein